MIFVTSFAIPRGNKCEVCYVDKPRDWDRSELYHTHERAVHLRIHKRQALILNAHYEAVFSSLHGPVERVALHGHAAGLGNQPA